MAKENGGDEQKKAQPKDGQGGGQQRPNILVLCIDQWDVHMRLPEGVELPALERLQNQGVTFDRHYCTVPICTPSRATMWTGQHAKKVGLWDNTNFAWIPTGLSPDVPTLGTMLREQGYYTAFKGKWHLSESKPGPGMLEPYGFADYQEWGDMFGSPLQGEMLDGTVAFETADWLENIAPGIDQPWLLVVGMVNPHDIMFYYSDSEAEFPEGGPIFKNMLHPAQKLGFFQDWDPELPANVHDDLLQQPMGVHSYQENIRMVYGAPPEGRDDLWKSRRNYLINCMRRVDIEFQRILDVLDRQNLWENTIVIYTSDHGEMNGAHGMHQKGAIHYDEAAIVNMTAVVPGGPQGQRTGSVGSHVDLVPTLLDFAGLGEDEMRLRYPQLRGRSLRGAILHPEQPGPRGSAQQPGDGALITWDGLNMLDPEWNASGGLGAVSDLGAGFKDGPDAALKEAGEKYGAPDFGRRTFFRAVVDGQYKLVRWFNPQEYARPGNLNDLYRQSDVTLHDLVNDPGEMENLASLDHPGYDPAVLKRMLGKLGALIERELDDDDCPFDLNMFGTREMKYKQAKAEASGDD
ncbi:sulfatase-like hydrolase/transferase [Deinococcus planocerae]|uniref:sulfatase-like hydrolase/transferase n=1 Tax=Deinococcus planocerae TaxID=1737569 RepID=UPI000C7F55DD|nr:sulfatase-like hydrolase/transferase [Deinococcus planocerae]